jgi:hypothetical protein
MTVNFKKKRKQSNAEKTISLKPLEFDEAVSDLLKVKPQGKKELDKTTEAEKKNGNV